ncbi:MAG: hypothetical protein J5940_03550 [Clostridia bacterium]|nr:hypothetical protein [Clostridia bacterium]
MLYPHSKDATLDRKVFENPGSEYRATPFWAWNCELDPKLLTEEIEYMKKMGFGGFHMHPRVGMATKYLSPEFFDLVKTCVDKAKREKMLAWLYDEDKWPSGFAGGYVTKDIENRRRYLFFTTRPYAADFTEEDKIKYKDSPHRDELGKLLAVFDIVLDKKGCLKSYKTIDRHAMAKGKKWYCYLEYDGDSSWFNLQGYADTLSKRVIKKFVEITHEKYKSAIGKEFGKAVPAIFTDEPQFIIKRQLPFADSDRSVLLPFTPDFPDTYKKKYGEDIIPRLPELLWELPDGKVSVSRYRYHDHIAERFADAFADTIGEWCEKNGIMLTGHMMQEPTLNSQTGALGDCMRSYRSFQLPGIDMLNDNRELTTAKQAQSAVHQYGREGMLSELYGVTNWTFDWQGHKLQGDWQAALGVTVRVPHLFWVSMRGEAKRDYPAAIGHQSPWYTEYSKLEDHFARVACVMTRGRPKVSIGVIHPVESYWLHWGPMEQTALAREALEARFKEITDWMLYGTLDFDFICESNLPDQFKGTEGGFTVGEMKYDTVIVPGCETMRSSTLSLLEKYIKAGGKVIVMGEAPKYLDAVPSDEPAKILTDTIPWSKTALYTALSDLRDIEIRYDSGSLSDNLIYQRRADKDADYVFISHVNASKNYDTSYYETYKIKIKGEYLPTELDTSTGREEPLYFEYANGDTVVTWKCGACSSLLLKLVEGKGKCRIKAPSPLDFTSYVQLAPEVPYELAEDNVYLIDSARYSVDGGEFSGEKNILKLATEVREKLRFPNIQSVQPWVMPTEKPQNVLTLKSEIRSEIGYDGALLGIELNDGTEIYFNGEKVTETVGYYVDRAITTFRLGRIKRGVNELVVTTPYGHRSVCESMYILGKFGVRLTGVEKTITEMPEKLGFASITTQGFPFYGGNVTYKCGFTGDGKRKYLDIPKYRGFAVTVDVDGKRAGIISLPPHRMDIGTPAPGYHSLDVTLLGNRMNTFGCLHNTCELTGYYNLSSPRGWRTSEYEWCDEYLVRQAGITSAPRIASV